MDPPEAASPGPQRAVARVAPVPAAARVVVAQAQRSPAAVTKQTTGLTPDGLPVHSFRSLLADLATLARNTVTTDITPNYPITVLTRPTSIQHKAFALLGITCSQ